MKNTRLLKLVILGGLVFGQVTLQQAWALDDAAGSLSGERLDKCQAHAPRALPARQTILRTFSDGLKQFFTRQGPVTGAVSNVVPEDTKEEQFYSLPSENPKSVDSEDPTGWELWSFGVGSQGQTLNFMTAAEKAETEAQYGRAIDSYNRQPGVIAARMGLRVWHDGVKPLGQSLLASWVGANFSETAIAATLAAYNTPLMRGAAAGVSAIVGCANPAVGFGLNKVLQSSITVVDCVAPLNLGLKLALHNVLYVPCAPHVSVRIESAGQKVQGLFGKLATNFRKPAEPSAF